MNLRMVLSFVPAGSVVRTNMLRTIYISQRCNNDIQISLPVFWINIKHGLYTEFDRIKQALI